MWSKFQDNAILTGHINSYCLVCDCYFESEESTLDHIKENQHEKQLLAYPYLEKYGDNHIRKVSKGYFCGFCSLLIATAASVAIHIQDKSHLDNKGKLLLRRSNDVVVAFDNIVISEAAWHGLIDDACAICNVEFDDEGLHKAQIGHLLSLVQNKLEFGANNNVYRKVDNSSFQCLTCNSILALSNVNEHFNEPGHKTAYLKCQEELKSLPAKTPEVQSKAVTKTAKKTDDNQNIVENDNKELVLANKKKDEEITAFAKENNLTFNPGQANSFCRLCEMKIPASLRCLKEHINGKEHKSRKVKAEKVATFESKLKNSLLRRPMSKFLREVYLIENIFYQDVVVNDRHCVSQASFLMLTKIDHSARFRCQSCEVNVHSDHVSTHVDTDKHEQAMSDTPVIISLPDSEFVREVRTEVFHCGYCNQVSAGVDSLSAHLSSAEHREEREASNWRLQRHVPDLRNIRRDQEEKFAHMMFNAMLHRRF